MANYVDSLGLDFDPFEVDRRAAHFYEGGKRCELLRQLVDLTHYGQDTLVVTGALGIGKSTLAQAFCRSFREESDTVLVRASLFMNEVQVLELICDQAGVDRGEVTSTSDLLSRLGDFASLLALEAGSLNVVIDDAHELGLEAVEVLGNLLKQAPEASVHLLLLGEKQLMGVLENTGSEAFAADQLRSFELNGFNVEDTANYLQFKLAGAGLKGALPIAGPDLGEIANKSAGIPAAINASARECLSSMEVFDVAEASEPAFNFPYKYLAVAATLFVALLVVTFTGGDEEVPASSKQVLVQGNTEADDAIASTPTVVMNADGTRSIQLQVPSSANSDSNAPSSVGLTSDDSSAIAGRTLEPSAGSSKPLRSLVLQSEVAGAGSSASDQVDAALTRISENVAATETAASQASALLSVLQEVADQPNAAAESVMNTDSPRPSSDFSSYETVMLAAPPSNYSLQLLGTHNQDSAERFVAAMASDDYGYIGSVHQGKPWYVVLYGSFPSRDAAAAAISRLPAEQQELQPWARSIAGVQADIRK